jgi:hypothetical protein
VKSKEKRKQSQKRKRKPSWFAIYHQESRDVGRSLALVLPLLIAYEIAVALLAPQIRNSAEMAVAGFVRQLPQHIVMTLRYVLLGALLAGTLWWLRDSRPRATVARPTLILTEALLLAVLLGPAVAHLVGRIGLSAVSVDQLPQDPAWLPFLMSVGAGLWEEIVFRLGLLGGLYVLLHRVFRMPELSAVGIGILISALAFALYHNVGSSGEPFVMGRFAFRAFAGTILGVLFAWRGLAIVVYMHVFYDVLCDIRNTLL